MSNRNDMTEHRLEVPGSHTRKVWLLEPPAPRAAHAAVFLDGEFYVNRMGTAEMLREMQARGELPAMPCVFVSQVDAAARHADLACHAGYAAFIARDVMGWLRGRCPALVEGGHLIAGPSLGGLASAFITLTHPGVFSRCLSQSGSFWWENERLTAMLPELPPSHARFWISVGKRETQAGLAHPPSGMRQEIPQIEGCERFAGALAKQGHEVRYNLHPGGHDLLPWAQELPDALRWLAEPRDTASSRAKIPLCQENPSTS